jgi:hypothetical protein
MYCEICESENCEHQDRTCPCCGDDPKLNCAYDTPEQRHLKNLLNGKPDEQWVTDGLQAAAFGHRRTSEPLANLAHKG